MKTISHNDLDNGQSSSIMLDMTPSDKKKVFYYQKITDSLVDLEEESKRFCAYLTYKFIKDDFKTPYIPISSYFLRDMIGGNYKPFIDDLINKGFLQLYVTNYGKTYSIKKGICKSYRFSDAIMQEIRDNKFTKTIVCSNRVYFDKKEKKNLINTNEQEQDPIAAKVVELYKNVTLLDSWQNELWPLEEIISDSDLLKRNFEADKQHAVAIGTGEIPVTIASTGRVFHPAITMRKKLREYIRFNNQKVVCIDVKAAHPCMLGKFASNEDRDRWVSQCKTGDIYKYFMDEANGVTKEVVKEAFQIAISYLQYEKKGLARQIVDYIEQEFPSIHSWLAAQWQICDINGKEQNTPQYILQSLESKIFIKGTLKNISRKFWLLPCHDGFLVEKYNAVELMKYLNKVAEKELGFKFTIEII